MRPVCEIVGEELNTFAWDKMVRMLMRTTFYSDRDFSVTPHNLLENGDITTAHPMDPAFDCQLLPTAYKRNLFRTYATIARVTAGVQLGIPENPLSKLRAVERGHRSIVNLYFPSHNDKAADALHDLYIALIKDVILPPGGESELAATDII